MILRDPVHGLVAFEGEDEKLARALLDTREMQRLRRIRQLGLISLVFIGAEHSRFAHSVGAAHVMIRLLERLSQVMDRVPAEERLDPVSRRDAIAAAFLHDIGHGPFSHLFEEIVPKALHHEDWTEAIIMDPSTEVNRALRAFDPEMPERVCALIRKRHPVAWLSSTVSGVLDVDRCDYLLRDSMMTGVRYGLYDLDWLLRVTTLAPFHSSGRLRTILAIEGRKGLSPVEDFFLARYFMHQQVYHHKATRAGECLVRAILRRASELVREGSPAAAGFPPALRMAALGELPSLSDYLELDDMTLSVALFSCEKNCDPLLSELSRRLRNRALFKTISLPPNPEKAWLWEEAHLIAKDIAKSAGFDPDLYVWLDLPEDVPYRDNREGEGMWVLVEPGHLFPLGEISFTIARLRNQRILWPRLCFAPELRDCLVPAVGELLGRKDPSN
ncbi:MAG: HD domain-containing protein [Sandaracinaceae bacterium]|nr:HD domain-containing protein [Sandaracinaceae bacterium]